MIKVHLYGDLRRLAPDPRPTAHSVVHLADAGTVADVLHHLGLTEDQVGNAFLNGQLLATQNSMAPWLGYATARDRVPDATQPYQTPLRPGDRLGLFPVNMGMLVV